MKTIVLIGMPGAGKTTIGRSLAKVLNVKFVDIDDEIEKVENISIKEIFSIKGEKYFRQIEQQAIKNIFRPYDLVISLGGGAFENTVTRDLLIKNANVIYLQTSVENIFQRTQNNDKRPLLVDNNLKKIEQILRIRQKNYKLAQFTVLTDNKDIEQVVGEICKCVN